MRNTKSAFSFFFQLFLILIIYYGYQTYLKGDSYTDNLFAADLLIILSAWLVTEWLTHKYKPHYYQRKWIYIIAPFLKAFILNLILLFLLSNLLKPSFNNGNLYRVLVIYTVIEILIYSILIFVYRITNHKEHSGANQTNKYAQDDLSIDGFIEPDIDYNEISTKSKFFSEEVTRSLHLRRRDIITKQKFNYKIIASVDDLHLNGNHYPVHLLDIRINDLKDINQTMNSIYQEMVPGGYLFAVYKNLEDFEKEFLTSKFKSVRFIKTVYYYLYYRAFPKIPYINSIYSAISGGHNKVISKAETWGRLFYNGFDVEKQITIDGLSYLLARKLKTPSENPAPSFYPIVLLNRVSLFGNIIQIHKIRSMYPYSEFLQKKVFEEGNLTSTGKFGNDFRITRLGKIYRKYWIDEIPQLLDWLRGKIKLVGIRAMSEHFFSLYPQEYKDLYYKVKPGIISPIFDEKTDGFSDIVRIEQEYLERFLKHPVKTDFKYFFITLNHMLKGVRSI